MKLATLMNASDSLRKINARLVKVVAYKTGMDRNQVPTAVAKTYTPLEYKIGRRIAPATDKKRYTSSIKFKDRAKNVEVSCSCPDFMFRFEYPNMEAGAAKIIYGNGDAPTVHTQIGLCKHLIALRRLIKQKHGV